MITSACVRAKTGVGGRKAEQPPNPSASSKRLQHVFVPSVVAAASRRCQVWSKHPCFGTTASWAQYVTYIYYDNATHAQIVQFAKNARHGHIMLLQILMRFRIRAHPNCYGMLQKKPDFICIGITYLLYIFFYVRSRFRSSMAEIQVFYFLF